MPAMSIYSSSLAAPFLPALAAGAFAPLAPSFAAAAAAFSALALSCAAAAAADLV